jgi:hypothetical protein
MNKEELESDWNACATNEDQWGFVIKHASQLHIMLDADQTDVSWNLSEDPDEAAGCRGFRGEAGNRRRGLPENDPVLK